MPDLNEKTGEAEEGKGVPPAFPEQKMSLPKPEEGQPPVSPTPPSGISPVDVSLMSESFPSPPQPPSAALEPEALPPPSVAPEAPLSEMPEKPSLSSSPLEREEPTLSPRLAPESPQAAPPPEPAASPEGSLPPPPPVGETISHGKPFIWKLLGFAFGAIILAALVFVVWKFVLPLLPAQVRPGGVTLAYWGLWEDENVLRPLFDEYEKNHRGVKIDYKKQNPKEYRERLQAAITQGKGPDIFRFHNTWLPMLKNELSPVPSNVFSQGDFQKTFYPVAVQDLKQGDSFYGIPLEIDGLSLLCNTEIFVAAGVSPPKTWDEFQKAAYALTVKDEKGKIQTAGLALGLTNNVDHWSDILAAMFLQNGVDLKAPQGKLAEDALIFYTAFAQGENKVWDETLPPSTLAFTQGKVAMIFAPSWQILAIKSQNPQLKFKVLPLPQLPGVNITWASYWVEGVSSKSSYQAEAWEFLKYLSQKENLVKFYTEASKTRLFGEPYSRQDLASSLKDDPYVGPYIQQASRAQSFYLASRTFDNGINDKIIKYFEDAVNSTNQGVSPRGALETAAKGVKQVLSTYGITTSSPSPK